MLQLCGSTLWGLLLALTPWRTVMCFSLHSDFMLLVEIPWLHHNSLSLGESSQIKRNTFLDSISLAPMHRFTYGFSDNKTWESTFISAWKVLWCSVTLCANSSGHHILFRQQSSKFSAILAVGISRKCNTCNNLRMYHLAFPLNKFNWYLVYVFSFETMFSNYLNAYFVDKW